MLEKLFKSKTDRFEFPDYLVISRRKVKWARIRVCADGEVRMVVPLRYPEREVRQLFEEKREWIERHRARCRQPAHQLLGIGADQLLLFGQGYDYVPHHREGDELDREAGLICSRVDLSHRETREKWYREFAKTYLSRRIDGLAVSHGFSFNRLYIRAQRTRWGSCSSRGNISLNWRLIKAPEWVSDYVILHELVHTRILNHSQAFWREVERVAPDYREARDWLKQFGPAI